ncbi:tetratricopeptide (TPR) repeat protein [Lewinella marina]|uniref:Tetratricopeptide repeat protein n=1 Tax=Neolewinella marina TaxID=438751 RepID=A0A2G0CHZ2_9BACT|nr:hypothetical protein [Neolewinella marina]NJB85337.1 tetratricopeptide (TPR) repeat protein [Neolewinella marina]PHK99547.1 hypothetical protein CGL56_00375 [Neolewinella marina]
MKQLSELIGLLDKDVSPCLDTHRDAAALRRLYDYVKRTEHPTAEAAAGELGMVAGSASFRKLKHHLKLEVLNAATALGPLAKSKDRDKRIYAYVWKLIAVGKQLRTSTNSTALLGYLEEAFRLADRYEMLDAAYQAAAMLRRQYVNRRFDRAKYQFYAERARWYGRRLRRYEDAVAAFNEVIFLRNTHQPAEVVQAAAIRGHARHASLVERYDLPIISYIVFLLELNIYLAVSDYEGVIRVAEEALAYLESRPTARPTMFQVFEANLSLAYTQLNDYDRGTAFARRLLAKTSPKDYNYIKVYELMLMLSLRAGKFQEAYESFLTIRPEMLSRNLRSYFRETFHIIEAYLYILIQLGQVEPRPDDQTFEGFRVSRFINSFEHVPGEKSHRNVHLLIVEIVEGIVNRKHRKASYSIEAIGKYASRHLRGRDYRRVRYFLKALAQLSVQQYHRAAVERHTRRYITLMNQHPLNESRLDYYMELVPYDVLWDLILQQLGYKRVRNGPKDKP